MKLTLVPNGWPCKIEDCPPGFFVYEKQLCFKSEYMILDKDIEVFNSAGEYFMPREVDVQPVIAEWN